MTRILPEPEGKDAGPAEIVRFQSFAWTRQEQIDNAFLDDTLQEMLPILMKGEKPSKKAQREKDEGA